MPMAFVFYGVTGLGSILFCLWYMNKYWSDERLARLERAESMTRAELGVDEPERTS